MYDVFSPMPRGNDDDRWTPDDDLQSVGTGQDE
jgi:hypothetical protein